MSFAFSAPLAIAIIASPILGWLAADHVLTGGYCEKRTRLAYPAMSLAFLGSALWSSQLQPELIFPGLFLGWSLIALFAFDIAHFVLPDFLTYSLLAAGVVLSARQDMDAALESAASAFAGGSSLLCVKLLYRQITKRDGLGMGDVKLFAAAGAWVGIAGLPQVLLIASGLGLFASLAYQRRGNGFLLSRIPFGIGLCPAIWATWILGPFADAF
jgi:leader peptidase (prepilin peptidase)/N-methyltransferase